MKTYCSARMEATGDTTGDVRHTASDTPSRAEGERGYGMEQLHAEKLFVTVRKLS